MRKPVIPMHDFGFDLKGKPRINYIHKFTNFQTVGFIKASTNLVNLEVVTKYFLVPSNDKNNPIEINMSEWEFELTSSYL